MNNEKKTIKIERIMIKKTKLQIPYILYSKKL